MDESHATLPVPTRTRRGEREAEQTYTGEAAQVSGLLPCTICFFPLGHRRRLRPRLPQAHLARQRPRIGFPLAAPPFWKACHCAQAGPTARASGQVKKVCSPKPVLLVRVLRAAARAGSRPGARAAARSWAGGGAPGLELGIASLGSAGILRSILQTALGERGRKRRRN